MNRKATGKFTFNRKTRLLTNAFVQESERKFTLRYFNINKLQLIFCNVRERYFEYFYSLPSNVMESTSKIDADVRNVIIKSSNKNSFRFTPCRAAQWTLIKSLIQVWQVNVHICGIIAGFNRPQLRFER